MLCAILCLGDLVALFYLTNFKNELNYGILNVYSPK